MNENYKIYVHINKINKKAYVGQTKLELEKRQGQNGCNYKGCSQFYAAIQKYGQSNFEHLLLEQNLSKDQVDEREKYQINFYNSFKNGYNATTGGNLNKEFSVESKIKMSLAKKEKYIGKGNPNYGRHRSEETKQKIREGNLGKNVSKETREKMKISNKGKLLGYKHTIEAKEKISRANSKRKVICLETGQIFNNAREAAEQAGIKSGPTAIYNCCRGKSKTSGVHPTTKERLTQKFLEEDTKCLDTI